MRHIQASPRGQQEVVKEQRHIELHPMFEITETYPGEAELQKKIVEEISSLAPISALVPRGFRFNNLDNQLEQTLRWDY